MDFKNALAVLMKYSLLNRNSYQDQNHKFKHGKELLFSVHNLTQLVMQDLLTKEEKIYFIESGITTINKLLPKYLFALIELYKQKPYIIPHMIKLSDHATSLGLYTNKFVELKLYILEFYLYVARDYINAKNLIEEIEKAIKHLKKLDDLLKIRFAIMKSTYLDKNQRDYEASIKQIKYAEMLINHLLEPPFEESLIIYRRLSKHYGFQNDNKNAIKYAELAKKIFDTHTELAIYKKPLYKVLIKSFFDDNNYPKALEYSNEYIESLKNAKALKAKEITMYLQQIDLLIRLGEYKKALNKLEWLSDHDNKLFQSFKSAYKPNILIYLSYARALFKKNIDQEIKTALKAQQQLKNILGEKRYYDSLYAYRHHYFLGEMYQIKNDNVSANQEYLVALQVIKKLYNTDTITGDLSDIYSKLTVINTKLQNPAEALRYLETHQHAFGTEDSSIWLTKYLVDSKVELGL
jgi:hypothetical protein